MADEKPGPALLPGKALLSPAWLIALAVLIANDHWLKQTSWAPELLTGKLSDLAGMVVAPVLLALALRVDSRRALAACHVAVGLVFAGIQLSPAFAGLWSALLGTVGYPWAIVSDPTDLLALPGLCLSWALLVPHMDPEQSFVTPLRHSAVAGLSALGLWASLATTEAPEFEFEPFFAPVFGNVFINNANDVDIALHVRYLREDVVVDCAEVEGDPGRLLSEAAFGEAEHWLLPPTANVGLEIVVEGHGCGAAWVAGAGIEPTIVFLYGDDFPNSDWEGSTGADDELGEAGLSLTFDDGGLATWTGGEDIRFTPRTDMPAQPDSCEPPAAEARIEWSDEVPTAPTELVALSPGIDGCFELELQEVAAGPVPDGAPYFWYLCAPAVAVPFVVGDYLRFTLMTGANGSRELDLSLLDPADLEPATNADGVPLRTVRLLHGGNDPALIGPAIDRELEGVADSACAWAIEPDCATAERVASMRVAGTTNQIVAGMPVSYADAPGPEAEVRTLALSYMRERAVLDQVCTSGAMQLRYDIDLALIEEPLL